MLSSGEFSTLLDWLGSIPGETIKLRPLLCLTYAWALLLSDNISEAISWILAAEAANGNAANPEAEEQWVNQIRGEVAAAFAFASLKQVNPEATLQYVVAYQQLNLTKSIFCSYGLNSNRGEASLLAGMFGFKGKLEFLEQNFLHIYRFTREIMTYHFGYIPVVVGELLYERGNIDEAVRLLTEGMRDAADSNTAASFVPAAITLARVEISRGKISAALEIIGDCKAKLNNMGGAHVLPLVSAFSARLNVLLGELTAAEEWRNGNCLEISDAPSSLRMYEQITLVRVLLAKKDYDSCILLLYKLLLFCEKEQYLIYTIELINLSAILNFSLGQTEKAMEMIEKALVLGEQNRYERIFIEEGAVMAELLEKFSRRNLRRDYSGGTEISQIYVRTLLRLTRDYSNTIKEFTKNLHTQQGEELPIKALTGREKEVLRLLETELTKAQIAFVLDIALNTVKVNCNNIYKKLNVRTRSEAVSVAHEKKLLY